MSDSDTLQILALSGSLRRASMNSGLLRAARRLAPGGLSIEIFDLRDVPLFDQDVEEEGDPDRVTELKNAVSEADALLLASPEYNGGVTGALKNAIDWASRPAGKSAIAGKPAAVLGATPGASGTRFSQLMLKHTLGVLGMPVLPSPGFFLARAHESFEDGELADPDVEERLEKLLVAFEDWVRRLG